MANSEGKDAREVMVIPASAWDRGEGFHRVRLESLFDRVRPSWLDKAAAEADPAFRQIIPVAIVRDKGGRVLAYQRSQASGESRLHGNWSILVGGHIERGLDDPRPQPDGAIYSPIPMGLRCLWRELKEEFGLTPRNLFQCDYKAMLAFDGDDVGKVHLGVVYELVFHGELALATGEEIATYEWIDPRDPAIVGKWEPWSALALQMIGSTTIEVVPGKEYLTITPERLMAGTLQDAPGAIFVPSDDKPPVLPPKSRHKANAAAEEAARKNVMR